MLSTILGIVVPWLLVAVLAWVVFELVRMSGRVLLRLDALQEQLSALNSRNSPAPPAPPPAPPALPIGTAAPDFDLPDLDGNKHTLAEYRGRRLLLIFFSPHCGFCTRMADALAALPPQGEDGRPMPLVISTGTVDDHRDLVQEYGLKCALLLQPAMEVANRYSAQGTPTGYLIDEDGKIASPIAIGADALLALAAPTPAVDKAAADAVPVNDQPAAPSANGHHKPCAKCKDGKQPCGCGRNKECANGHAAHGASANGNGALREYDLVELTPGGAVADLLAELTQRAAHCRRLVVVPGSTDGLSEIEASALRRFLRQSPDWLVSYRPNGAGRFLVLSNDPADRKVLPSKLAMAGGLVRALATHIGDGRRRVTAEQLEQRLEECSLCDKRTGESCSACGCNLTTKAGWRTSKCPLGKWPESVEAAVTKP